MSDLVEQNPIAPTESLVPAACGAKIRNKDAYCGLAAGWRTPHVGEGRCYLHGGLSPRKHGRYSMIKSVRMREILEELERDPDPLNLTPEVQALRMLTIDYINRYEEYTNALLAWYQSWTLKQLPTERVLHAIKYVLTEWEIIVNEANTPTPQQYEMIQDIKQFLTAAFAPDQGRPRQVLDIADAKNILAETGKMVERIEKIRSQNAVSRPELNRIYQEMWRAVDGLVDDDDIKKQIRHSWLNIAL